jgi:hypothetical protein
MPATVPAVVPIPVAVERHPNMTKQFLLLFIAIMILMVAFAYEVGTLAVESDNIRIEHHVVKDGTWVDTSTPYKLPEKKHFWTLP